MGSCQSKPAVSAPLPTAHKTMASSTPRQQQTKSPSPQKPPLTPRQQAQPSPQQQTPTKHKQTPPAASPNRPQQSRVGSIKMRSNSKSPARDNKSNHIRNGGTNNNTPTPRSSPAKQSQMLNGRVSQEHWASVYKALHPFLLDPADVHSSMSELMARTTNLLSPVEITHMQRRVRHVVSALATNQGQAGPIMGRVFSNNNQDNVESRNIVDKFHLLSEHAFRRIVMTSSSSPTTAPLLESSFVLLSYLSEPLWDRVAEVAAESAKKVGLEMDVNKKPKRLDPIPEPITKSGLEDALEPPTGISFSALSFLFALALRGARPQRLQLLYYLMLPSKTIKEFLEGHPAGGVPLWLLEVDNECILSWASMTHYYYHGTAFAPSKKVPSYTPAASKKLAIQAQRVQEVLQALLYEKSHEAAAAMAMSEKSPSPTRRANSYSGMMRRNSKQQDVPDPSAEERMKLSDLGRYLYDIRIGKKSSYDDADAEVVLASGVNGATWTMNDFYDWAEKTLDDSTLDVIFHRLFLSGILPSPSVERELVASRWIEWQESDRRLWATAESEGTLEFLAESFRKLFQMQNGDSSHHRAVASSKVWGGIGGYDGRGGLGLGVMYCVDKMWWDAWEAYVGWNWDSDEPAERRSRDRPGGLSNEALLDRDQDNPIVPGSLGSFELMKTDLVKGKDYVLLPPGVWDILYEMYGGGPPLPRMAAPPQRDEMLACGTAYTTPEGTEVQRSSDHGLPGEAEVALKHQILRLPDALNVETHPWVLHFHVCDPMQPYRRGDAGPLSIRVMATPEQHLWRLYAEVIVRLPIHNVKAFGTDGRGRARLWKRIEQTGPKDATTRYGPWVLLCKNRFALLPMMNSYTDLDGRYDELMDDWQAYADHSTVESIGLSEGDQLMVEFAVLNRNNEWVWPREAAAKAGRVRRLADEDMKFRRTLRGVDDNGSALSTPPDLVGLPVDAMDSSGRWYQVEIVQVEDVVVETDEEDDEGMGMESSEGFGGDAPLDVKENNDRPKGEERRKQVRVDFAGHGGHQEWIDIESDRLATAGRFTMNQADENLTPPQRPANGSGTNGNDQKPKPPIVQKKTNPETTTENGGKVCTFPGYGAVGLANLGNTCYANSAIQCISYMPLLRAYLLSAKYKTAGDLNKDNPLGTGGKMLEEVAELLRIMWSARMGEKSPNRFRAQLGKNHAQFSGADQHDAQEFLNYMLDVLHEDSNRVRNKPYVEALEDDWVKKTRLPRVGDESWRRFLRRNRSIMADVAMGQVLNTVTCPVCHHSSRIFDPFNLLSVPFPTVADVIFQCTVVRRATAFNCPWVLNRPRRGDKRRNRFVRNDLVRNPKPPSEQFSVEQYVVAMSRLADSGDLRLQLQNVCGIPAGDLRLCTAEEIIVNKNADDKSSVKRHWKLTPLTEKEGPCVHLARTAAPANGSGAATPTRIIAYEGTLRRRPQSQIQPAQKIQREPESDSTTEEDDDSEEKEPPFPTPKEKRILQRQLDTYGDSFECRVYDTDPLLIAKAMSRSLWPTSETELKLGLRVDAIDHRDHWFPGSVIEIIEGDTNGETVKDAENAGKRKVRIHFDNFSSKWDEMYTIDHFKEGRVRPLYSHSAPRPKPTEFIVHHRHTDRASRHTALFGQSFYVQCPNEWSTARAGAHILAQASRYMKLTSEATGPVDVDAPKETEAKVQRLYEKTQSAISDLIDLLIECDREYVRLSLAISEHNEDHEKAKPFRNPAFDATSLSTALVKKVTALLHRLPFDVRVCMVDAPLGEKANSNNEEVPFPFSLMRTIGNYINARHAVVLQWREPPSDKKGSSSSSSSSTSSRPGSYLNAPVMYVSPRVAVDKVSEENLTKDEAARDKNNNASPGSAGMHLGVCLSEFCKVQQLSLTDNWRCPRCKEFREGKQNLNLWRLPDLMTFHIKRFNCSARWREKITTKVNFPLTGLDLSQWCHPESPAIQKDSEESYVYDLIGVINHYGSMTGGHYVATCKATACGRDGREEVAFTFNGAGASALELEEDADAPTGWRIGRPKVEVNQNKVAAAAASKFVSESAEPLWLQFDDDLVEPIPPRHVVSEMAYVLFYRRRRLTPANIAKYSTLE